MTRGRGLILSASRRTDLPGFHAETCAERIRLKISRLRTRHLYGVVFWTRHLKPFLHCVSLRTLVKSELANPVVNLTITGLGGSALEPGAPPTASALADLPALIDVFKSEPQRVRWRFDPLLKNHTSIDAFADIAKVAAGLGIPTCTVSFPAYRSLKGDLTPQFESAGIPRWQGSEKAALLNEMADIATHYGISLLSCSQPENTVLCNKIAPAQCIPAAVLQRGHPENLPLDLGPDRSQRTHCHCIESEDIGDYEQDRCLGGCVYCYSKAGGPLP